MSATQTLTMPGQVNTDIGVIPYTTSDPSDVQITASTGYDGYIYNVLSTATNGTFFVEKVSTSGQKDSTWGSGSTDFSDASFVIFTQVRATPTSVDASNYAFTDCKLDKMFPQSISIHNDRVYIVGNTTFDVTDCSGVGGDTFNTNEYPMLTDYTATDILDWQGEKERGFLTVLKLSDGQLDTDYFDKAYNGDPTSSDPDLVPIQINDSKEKRFFASSATIYTSVNKDNQNGTSTNWDTLRMPTPSIADNKYIYVTPAVDDGNLITDALQANEYVENSQTNYLNANTEFNCSTYAPSALVGGDCFLIVGSEESTDGVGLGPDECTSIVVRAYENNLLQGYDSFNQNNTQSDGLSQTSGVLVIDPSGTSAGPKDPAVKWSGSAGTVALQSVVNGNGTFIMGGGCKYTLSSDSSIAQPPFLCKFDISGVIDTTFGGDNQNLNYLGFITPNTVAQRVTNISPNIPSDTDSLIVMKSTPSPGDPPNCVITKVDNSTGLVNTSFGTVGNPGQLEPAFSGTTISVGNDTLFNTNSIGYTANECYLALNSFSTSSGLTSGLVIKFSTDGEPSTDFGEGGYAFFGATNTPYNNVLTNSVIIVNYLQSAQASIAWAFGGGANSPYQSIGIPFNLLPSSGICFPAGTPINTDQGIKNIEDISTRKNTINGKKINSITRTIMKRLDYLVVLEKDCIENNVPSQQTICSPDHKILYRNKMIEASLLIERKVRGVYAKKYDKSPLYNVLLDSHSTMIVNNMITETLHPKNPIAMLYSNIPQSVKNRAMIYNNLKENETQLNPNKSFLLQKHVPKPVFKERRKLEFSLKR